MFVRDPGARTSGPLSMLVFWDSKCSRTRLVVSRRALVEGFSLARARRRRRSGALVTVAVVFGPFFVVRVAFLRSSRRALSGGSNLRRLQRRAPTVLGRRPRASRGSRGGFRGATRGYFRYWLFSASARVTAPRSASQSGRWLREELGRAASAAAQSGVPYGAQQSAWLAPRSPAVK